MKFAKKLNNATKRLAYFVLATILVGVLSLNTPSVAFNPTMVAAADPAATAQAIGTGVKAIKEIVGIYNLINPPQEGYVSVINSTNQVVTVRSYNNNDWLMLVAAGQINLKPGSDGKITASSNPVKLVWKRGNYGTVDPFGTKNLSQSVAPKDAQHVFVIGDANTF
jgi:hypothetical protein